MIMKLLLIIGVIAFVYFFFIKKKPQQNIKNNETKKSQKLQGNDMIECPECSIFFEVDDGILSSSKYYCSSECVSKATK